MEEPKGQRTDKRNTRNGKGKDSGAESPRSSTPIDESPKGQRNGTGNGKPKNNSGKNRSNNYQNQKKDEPQGERKQIPPIGNERFDNAYTLGGGQQSHANSNVADAKRLAEAVPPSGVSAEVDAQVRRILEIVPEQEYHIVYGILEDHKFDEQNTTNYFLNKKRDEPTKQQASSGAGAAWNAVVKGKLKNGPVGHSNQNFPPHQQQQQHRKPKDERPQQNPHPQQNAHPQQNNHHQAHHGQAPPHFAQPVQHIEHQLVAPPEEIVYSLEAAINSQIQMIQQQSQMLMALQLELQNVTQGGSNEMQALLDDQARLLTRRSEVIQELDHINSRLEGLDIAIKDKERSKNKRLEELASRSSQLGFYRPQY